MLGALFSSILLITAALEVFSLKTFRFMGIKGSSMGTTSDERTRSCSASLHMAMGQPLWTTNELGSDESTEALFDSMLDIMISTATINTATYYMLEFHNEIDFQFMSKFKQFNVHGFNGLKPTDYIESMIRINKTTVKVLMNPPKKFGRGLDPKRASLARVQYLHTIEPRKVAHQILMVRDDISNELLIDLNVVKLEHEESMKYCNTYLRDGPEAAAREPRWTGEVPGSSTPYRKANFYDCSFLITNTAIEMIRSQYRKSDSLAELSYFDSILNEVNSMKQVEKDATTSLARRLLDKFYLNGLVNGLVEHNGVPINALKMAQTLFETRLNVAIEASKMISEQSRLYKQFFSLIKSLGGFSRIDFTKPDLKVVYIDELDLLSDGIEAIDTVTDTTLQPGALVTGNDALEGVDASKLSLTEFQQLQELSPSVPVTDVGTSGYDDGFDQFGPMSM